jgi:hypothetical protein
MALIVFLMMVKYSAKFVAYILNFDIIEYLLIIFLLVNEFNRKNNQNRSNFLTKTGTFFKGNY